MGCNRGQLGSQRHAHSCFRRVRGLIAATCVFCTDCVKCSKLFGRFGLRVSGRVSGRGSKRGRKGVEKVNNYCIWPTRGKTNTIPSECLFVLIYQLEIVGDESATSIDYYDEFYVKF